MTRRDGARPDARAGPGARRSTTGCSSAPARGSRAPTATGWRRSCERLASLGTAFGQNVLADEKAWSSPLAPRRPRGPAGLARRRRGAGGGGPRARTGHVVTLSRSLIVPFLQLSPRRDLRERALPRLGRARRERRRRPTTAPSSPRCWRCARSGRGCSATRTSPPASSSPRWRRRPEAVRDLLMAVWEPARARGRGRRRRLEEMMRADGVNGPLEPWDWRYYAAMRQARRARPRRGGAEALPRARRACATPPSTSRAGCSG